MTENLQSPVSPYFFLSYARADPLAGGGAGGNPDHLIEWFFEDLSEAVRGLASRAAGVTGSGSDEGKDRGGSPEQADSAALPQATLHARKGLTLRLDVMAARSPRWTRLPVPPARSVATSSGVACVPRMRKRQPPLHSQCRDRWREKGLDRRECTRSQREP